LGVPGAGGGFRDFGQVKGPARLVGRRVVSDTGIPPTAFAFGVIIGELHFKAAFAVVAWLSPRPCPDAIGEGTGQELAVLPGIGSVSLFIKLQVHGDAALLVL